MLLLCCVVGGLPLSDCLRVGDRPVVELAEGGTEGFAEVGDAVLDSDW